MKPLVFTPRALSFILANSTNIDVFDLAYMTLDGKWGVLSTEEANGLFFIHRDDMANERRVILFDQPVSYNQLPKEAWKSVFLRIYGTATTARNRKLRLPPSWGEFHEKNYFSYFACAQSFGCLRWTVERSPNGSDDFCFWELSTRARPKDLRSFQPPKGVYELTISGWPAALKKLKADFAAIPIPPESQTMLPMVNLDSFAFRSVTQDRTYSRWLPILTERQRQFLESPITSSVKLRGPAGTGKTLLLELKALKAAADGLKANQDFRVLFATHSWELALQVDEDLSRLDEQDVASAIEVFPLLFIAKERVFTQKSLDGEIALLGEDSLEGKQEQLRMIGSALDEFTRSDWVAYRELVSPQLQSRLDSTEKVERARLVWDLLLEVSCVLSAHAIWPGVNAEKKYLALQRMSWMMPLISDHDKRVILGIYSRYMRHVQSEGKMSSDQLMSDFVADLESYIWYIRRAREGYDLIVVDELHLFNYQERLALHFLTRSADSYPVILMALDPRQSPAETYFAIPGLQITNRESDVTEGMLGKPTDVELEKIHRFSPEILALVQHVQQSYPALDLGPDWNIDIGSLSSTAKHGPKPTVQICENETAEWRSVANAARHYLKDAADCERVAIIVLNPLSLPLYEKVLSKEFGAQLIVISGPGDAVKLERRRIALVLSASEYVQGIQFDFVLICGFPDYFETGATPYQLRRLLSLFYLGVSRARRVADVFLNLQTCKIPAFLEAAIEKMIIDERQCDSSSHASEK